MTHDEMIEVIKAHKEGKTIQISCSHGVHWADRLTNSSSFDFSSYTYRVKPEPITVYARLSSYGTVTDVVTYKEHAQYAVETYGGRLVKLVEVPEE